MSAFCEDDESIAKYPQGIYSKPRPENSPLIRCLQWGDNVKDSERDATFQSAKELTDTASKDRLRVVFMLNCTGKISPLDVQELKKLFKYFSVPSDVLTERACDRRTIPLDHRRPSRVRSRSRGAISYAEEPTCAAARSRTLATCATKKEARARLRARQTYGSCATSSSTSQKTRA